jgi:hypothetical protein
MSNFITNLKKNHTNIYALVVSLLLAVWYNGISGLITVLFPNRGMSLSIIMLIVPVVFFLLEDGKLEELYKAPNVEYPVMASAYEAQKKEKFNNKYL